MAANFYSAQFGEKEMSTAAVSRSVKLHAGLQTHLDAALRSSWLGLQSWKILDANAFY